MTGSALDAVCDRVMALRLERPIRVAVDGITAAGTTTFANSVADSLRARSRDVIRASMDGFHHPAAVRHRNSASPADGYYEDAYDFGAVRRLLLDPLGPGGDRRYRDAIIDLASDIPVDSPAVLAPHDAVLVVDGSFLQKASVRDAWDLVIYLRTSFAAAEERGARRDAAAFGGIDVARAAFRGRYHAAQRRYLSECEPEDGADVVVDVDDPASPTLVR